MADSNKQVINTLELAIITDKKGEPWQTHRLHVTTAPWVLLQYKHVCPRQWVSNVSTHHVNNNSHDSSDSFHGKNLFFFCFVHWRICHPLLIHPIMCLLLTHLSLLERRHYESEVGQLMIVEEWEKQERAREDSMYTVLNLKKETVSTFWAPAWVSWRDSGAG